MRISFPEQFRRWPMLPMIKTQARLIVNFLAAAAIGLKIDPMVLETAWEV